MPSLLLMVFLGIWDWVIISGFVSVGSVFCSLVFLPLWISGKCDGYVLPGRKFAVVFFFFPSLLNWCVPRERLLLLEAIS